ncbi:MAG: CGNR zinc finger domain-containing protein [Massilia sp.]
MGNEETANGAYVLVGDHLALDLLNTQSGMGEAEVELWQTGAQVVAWCRANGIAPARDSSLDDQAALLGAAHQLRAIARQLIEAEKAGQGGDATRLNPYLAANLSARAVVKNSDGAARLVRTARADAATQLLGALAESVAELLCEGEFALVKQCEHPDCIQWFYDRTKAHRRRWCSMAVCGNRFKAAQFRKNAAAAATKP